MFKKIKTSQFRMVNTLNVEEEAKQIVRTLSGDIKNFSDLIDSSLVKQIVSRRVSQLFLSTNSNVFEEYPYVTILVEIEGKDLVVTLGSVNSDGSNVVFLNGVLEI